MVYSISRGHARLLATRFQNQSGRKKLVLRLKSYFTGQIPLNRENVKEGIAQCVEKLEKDRVIDRA